jgi:hypothetical protein
MIKYTSIAHGSSSSKRVGWAVTAAAAATAGIELHSTIEACTLPTYVLV